ncbi:FG-GAP repeat domain-containing protein [Methanopyrus kandleri]
MLAALILVVTTLPTPAHADIGYVGYDPEDAAHWSGVGLLQHPSVAWRSGGYKTATLADGKLLLGTDSGRDDALVEVDPATGHVLRRYSLEFDPGDCSYSVPLVAHTREGTWVIKAYRTTKDERNVGAILAINIGDGATRYLVDADLGPYEVEETRVPTVFPVACLDVDRDGDEEVIVEAPSGMFCYDVTPELKRLWWFKCEPVHLPDGVSLPAILDLDGSRLLVVLDVRDGVPVLHAVDVGTGEERWSIDLTQHGVPRVKGYRSVWKVMTGDLDGDGKPELVVTLPGAQRSVQSCGLATKGSGESYLVVLRPRTDGADPVTVLKISDVYPLNSGFGHPAALGDIDGDGKDELITFFTDRLRVFKLHGDRLEQVAEVKPGVTVFWSSVCLIDLTGDGRPEVLLSGNPGRTVALRYDHGQLYVLWEVPYPAQVNLPVPVDSDRDGKVDTLVLYSTEHGIVALKAGRTAPTRGEKSEGKRRRLPLIPVPPIPRRRRLFVATLVVAVTMAAAPVTATVPLYCEDRADPSTVQALKSEVHRQIVDAVHWLAEQEKPTETEFYFPGWYYDPNPTGEPRRFSAMDTAWVLFGLAHCYKAGIERDLCLELIKKGLTALEACQDDEGLIHDVPVKSLGAGSFTLGCAVPTAPSSEEEAQQLKEWVGFYTSQSLPGIVAVYRLVDDPEVKERAKRIAYRAIEAMFKHYWREEEVTTPEGTVEIGYFQVQGPGAWSDRTRTTPLVLWAILWSGYRSWNDREVQLMWNLLRFTEKERTVRGIPVAHVGDIKIDCDSWTLCALAAVGNTVDSGPLSDLVRKLVNCIMAHTKPTRGGLMAVACHFGELEEEPGKAFLAHKAARAYYGLLQAGVPPDNRLVTEIVRFCLKAHRIDPNEKDPVTGLQGTYKDDVPYWCWTDVEWKNDYRGLKCFCTGITLAYLAEWYSLVEGNEPSCRSKTTERHRVPVTILPLCPRRARRD